ncbi:MAG: hypothetical protein ACKVY0_15130 [Prosthecobacter sp.]|uniref:hypothetical protein n=1 Tax=Prosthecobacter sp. TaxID=1965333 RepID=UPI0038FE4B38
MNIELDLRLKAFNRSLGVLDLAEHVVLWKDKAPVIFTTKHDEATSMAAALEDAAKKQEAGLGGVADEKDREEAELEDAAFVVAQALLSWFNDQKQETEAGEVDFAKSSWQGLRDQQLLTKSQRVIDLAATVVGGPNAAKALDYGITAGAVTELTKERKDYWEIVNEPGVAQSVRKALTKGFRPAFALVEKKFKELDGLILQFGKTATGKSMIAAWKDARVQKGQANGDEEEKKPAEPVKPA